MAGVSFFLFFSSGAGDDNVKIVPYDTPIRGVLQIFGLVKFKQDPENVSQYTIQT